MSTAGPEFPYRRDGYAWGTRSLGRADTVYLWSLQIIKPKDGDPLTREDLQMTLLTLLFQDTEFRFTPPAYPDALKALFPTDRTWSFAELYLDCLANSSKANKNLKDKMGESTSYAVSFAQLCFLINIGRMNTTLACAYILLGWRSDAEIRVGSLSGNEDRAAHIPSNTMHAAR